MLKDGDHEGQDDERQDNIKHRHRKDNDSNKNKRRQSQETKHDLFVDTVLCLYLPFVIVSNDFSIE
jgi:hypothetical protein